MASYTVVLFCLGTVFIAMNAWNAQLSYIDNRGYPGGPLAFSLSQYSKAILVVPNTAFILTNWFADGLLLFRCKVIWDNQYWVLILPILMYLGSISMGIMTIFQSSPPNASLWSTVTVDFGLPYFSLSNSLNVSLTLLIASRLYFHHCNMKKSFGANDSRGAVPYLSIVGMLVESSAIYAVSSLLFIGTYAAGSGASLLFLPILSQTQIVAPLLIISRVTSRQAYGSRPIRSFDVSTTVDQNRTLVETPRSHKASSSGLRVSASQEKVQTVPV